MTVTFINEIEERGAEYQETFNLATDEQERTYTRAWRIRTDDATDDAYEVILAGRTGTPPNAVPAQWASFDDSHETHYLAKRFRARKDGDRFTWIVEAEYGLCIDPTQEPALIRRSTGQTEWAIEQDVTGAAIANTAGDPFDPPVTVPAGHLVFVVTKNISSVDGPNVVANYLFRTNSATFYGHLPGLVWLADFSDAAAFRNAVHYRETSWTFHVRPGGNALRARDWHARPLNCGYRQKKVISGVSQLVMIRGPDGQPVSSPALLALDGTKLAAGGTPNFRDFTVYDTADFNDLGINGART